MTTFIPDSNALDLDRIRVRKQNRNANVSQRRSVVAIDTETDDKADIFLLADSDGNTLELDEITFENVATFLLKHEGKWIFCYNLGFDAEGILKLLPENVLKSYLKTGELRFTYKGYRIVYFNRKKLSISKGKRSVSLYDIAQYYDGKALTEAYQDTINKPLDSEYLAMKLERRRLTRRYFRDHKKRVRRYCIADCILTKELAENWIDTFYQVFGFYPRNWISAGNLAEKVLIHYGIAIPYFHEIPYDVQAIARASFYGGRFELVVRGFIGECYLYDINSAYPYALTNLPNLTKGKWIRTKRIHPKAAVGFFHIVAEVGYETKIAPFPFRTKNNTIIYPCGRFRTYVTLEELKTVQKVRSVKYKILESWQFIPDPDCDYPFKAFIEEQYGRRLALKEKKNPLERTIKIILNSIWGKTAQRINNIMGNLFFPAIAAYVTGFTRAQLYRFMLKNKLEREIVAFATDSIACRKKIPDLNSKILGEMKLDKESKKRDVIFLSNGFYMFDGIWKKRGIGNDKEKKVEIEHLTTRIDEDGQLWIGVRTTKTVHIRSGIIFNKLKDVNKIVEYEKKIRLNSDKKRSWLPAELKSLKDKSFCDSTPINAELVADIIGKKGEIAWEAEQEERYEPESDL